MPPVGSSIPCRAPGNGSVIEISDGVFPTSSIERTNIPNPHMFPAPENSSLITSFASSSGESILYASMSIGVREDRKPGTMSAVMTMTAACTRLLRETIRSAIIEKSRTEKWQYTTLMRRCKSFRGPRSSVSQVFLSETLSGLSCPPKRILYLDLLHRIPFREFVFDLLSASQASPLF